ncbi:MAG TPA: MBOAT family protein [Rhizomicrobium sp.]|jgi:D-alanyl-lipoteichoic acid acyltransferase DltB (MBOAT superfamily)|nr:MBOAT family protein [Rhizomicrobium sp.]
MPFNSYPYFVFLAVAVLGFRLLEKDAPVGRRVFLLLASYAFYAWWRADFLLLLCGSTLVNYALGCEIERRRMQHKDRRGLLIAGLVFNLGLIATFKYDTLFVSTANDMLGLGLPVPHFFLPLAISFFTFEQISYLVDADAGKTHNYGLLDYALFVAYFPHLIAGPIVRHNDLIPQFRQLRAKNDDLAAGITLFTIGLAKKSLIADNLAPFADAIFNAAARGTHLGPTDSWLGTLFFAFQIYFDFSAYSDMALGSSLMLGIRLPVNFHSPYKSASIIEFWRRWHISLSAFLRDYLYVPLGGNRKGRVRRYLNLFITMLLGGLWHGAHWTFMLWGGLHGFYLSINHAFRHATKGMTVPPPWRLPLHAASVLLTFAATTLAWIVFRAPDLPSAGNVVDGLLGGGHSAVVSFSPLAAVTLLVLFLIVWLMPNSMELIWRYHPALPSPYPDQPVEPAKRFSWRPRPIHAAIYGLMCIVAVLALSNLKPFIYFQF